MTKLEVVEYGKENGQLIAIEVYSDGSTRKVTLTNGIVDYILNGETKKENPIRDIIQDAVHHISWERAHRTEEILKGLVAIGINPKNCFLDNNDNLIIPFTEIPEAAIEDRVCEWNIKDIGKIVVDENGKVGKFISRCDYPSFCVEYANGDRLDAAIGSPLSQGWKIKETKKEIKE
jgi:hypothetical protein